MAIIFKKAEKTIFITSPQTVVTIQELINEIRDYEDNLDFTDYKSIANATGKQDLGGNVLVGITLELLDGWRIQFESRWENEFNDGYGYGYYNGYEYDDWNNYFNAVETISCGVTGGNLVAKNEYDNNPIKPSPFTQVSVTSSSSATLSEMEAIQYSSYGGGISLDVINGTEGTDYPIGNMEFPVNNILDAVTIANLKGFKTLFIIESIDIDSEAIISNMTLIGRSLISTVIKIEPDAICNGITVKNCIVKGDLDGQTNISDCIVMDINYMNGYIKQSSLEGTIILSGSLDASFFGCSCGNLNKIPTINMGGKGQNCVIENWSGKINIINTDIDSTNKFTCQINGGKIILNSTNVLGGTFYVNGIGELVDQTNTTIPSGAWNNNVLVENKLINEYNITKYVWDETTSSHQIQGSTGEALSNVGATNVWDQLATSHDEIGTMGSIMNNIQNEMFGKWILDPTAKTMTLYKEDNKTILKIFNLTTTTANMPSFTERIPQ